MPGRDLVGFVLPEEHAERRVDAGADHRGAPAALVLVEVGDPLGLCEQPRRFHHRVVAPDQHTECVRLLGAGVRRQRILRTRDLERGDFVVPVIEQLVVELGGSGQCVERVIDGHVVVPGPAFDGREVVVERGFDRLGGGAYLGSGGLRSIRHSADAIRTRALPAQ